VSIDKPSYQAKKTNSFATGVTRLVVHRVAVVFVAPGVVAAVAAYDVDAVAGLPVVAAIVVVVVVVVDGGGDGSSGVCRP